MLFKHAYVFTVAINSTIRVRHTTAGGGAPTILEGFKLFGVRTLLRRSRHRTVSYGAGALPGPVLAALPLRVHFRQEEQHQLRLQEAFSAGR